MKTQKNTRETPCEIKKLYEVHSYGWGNFALLSWVNVFGFSERYIIEESPLKTGDQFYEKLCKEKYTVFGQNKGFSLVTIYLMSRVFPGLGDWRPT